MRAAHKTQIADADCKVWHCGKKILENKSAKFPFSRKQYKWADAMPERFRRDVCPDLNE